MTRRDEKRAEIADRLTGHVLQAGLGDTGLRRLAEIAGTSDRMLLYYFENKDDILTVVLTRIASGLAESLGDTLALAPMPPGRALAMIWQALKGDGFADQLRLWLDLSSHASRGDPFFGEAVARIGEDWVVWLSGILDVPEADKAPLAILMMAAVDGLVVLYPTDLAKGDAAIDALVGMLDRRP